MKPLRLRTLPDYVSADELAKILGCSVWTIYRGKRSGLIGVDRSRKTSVANIPIKFVMDFVAKAWQ